MANSEADTAVGKKQLVKFPNKMLKLESSGYIL